MPRTTRDTETPDLDARRGKRRSPPRQRRALQRLRFLLLLAAMGGGPVAQASGSAAASGPASSPASGHGTPHEARRWMTVGERRFAITLADTRAARAFDAMLPLTLDMEELNGNEKKKDLAGALPTDATRPGSIRNGDILLWGARTVVVFYMGFESPYAYTRLGRVDKPAGLAQALGPGGVRVVFSRR
jgi:hypothetical protein